MTQELYQEILLEHAKSPRNTQPIADALSTEEHNTLCGDAVTVYLKADHGKVSDVSCIAQGCVLSKASASLLTETLKGKSIADALKVIEALQHSSTGEPATSLPPELAVLAGVSQYPARVKCVTMVWHAAKKLLGSSETQNHEA
jgi:nitrogen fixation NifU-like protein